MSVKDLATRNNILMSVIVMVIIGLIIYYIYDYIRKLIHDAHNEPILIKDVKNAKAAITFSAKDIMPAHNAFDGTYMIWLNVNDTNWNSGSKKHIFNKGTDISVIMEESQNNIQVDVRKEDGDMITIKIENFPLHRWFHLVIVNTKHSSEIYIDGELYTSKVINGSIKSHANSDLSVTKGGGFGGFVSQFRYYNRSVLHTEIKKTYSKGPQPFTILDLSKLVKRYVPKLDITVGGESAWDYLKGSWAEIKKDVIDPVANTLDGAANKMAGGEAEGVGAPIIWGYGPNSIPTCYQSCEGAGEAMTAAMTVFEEIQATEEVMKNGGDPPPIDEMRQTIDDLFTKAQSACSVIGDCPSACSNVNMEGGESTPAASLGAQARTGCGQLPTMKQFAVAAMEAEYAKGGI